MRFIARGENKIKIYESYEFDANFQYNSDDNTVSMTFYKGRARTWRDFQKLFIAASVYFSLEEPNEEPEEEPNEEPEEEPEEEPGNSFRWPTTAAPYGDGSLNADDWPQIGMLKYMGYRVGKSSELTISQRQQILVRIFSIYLPNVMDPYEMREWHEPKSMLRLKKLADTLAANTRNAKRRNHDGKMNSAINDWETDLAWLKEKYYDGVYDGSGVEKFDWPSTYVG